MATTKGERKFVRNMAGAGALGASAGEAGAAIATRGRSGFRPVRAGAIGAGLGAAAGGGAVHLKHKGKIGKSAGGLSAFGIDHGKVIT